MKRYVLIDFNHLAHKFIMMEPLSATITVNGYPEVVDTTIPNGAIKNVYNYSNQGTYYTGVFLEGGSGARKKYFAQAQAGGKSGYKGGRTNKNALHRGIDLSVQLMADGGVSLYRIPDFEADDVLASMVNQIKESDPNTPIDVITNDSDLLPLVDEQVSVYIRGKRQFAEEGCPVRRLYFQVTPRTWDDYLSYRSDTKGYLIPYNSMLLYKLIKGDKADEFEGAVKGYGKVKYSNLMQDMMDDGVPFDKFFRYGNDFNKVMRPLLEIYFSVEEVDRMEFIYNGINPKRANLNPIKQIDFGRLQKALLPVRINL